MKIRESIFYNKSSCRFEMGQGEVIPNELPLSVILQVTRHCNFSCVFCSETEKMADSTLEEMQRMRDNLCGVPRIYLSGGEPLLRKDLPEVLDMFYSSFIVGLPTNAVIHNARVDESSQGKS